MSEKIRTAATDETKQRLEKCRDEVASAVQALANARRRRNRLIVEAHDGGLGQKLVARLAGVSQPHVVRVLGDGDFGEVLEA